MPFSASKFIKFRSGMQKRIEALRVKSEESLELAVDTMMQERVDSFSTSNKAWRKSSNR